MNAATNVTKITSAHTLARDWETATSAQQATLLGDAIRLGRESGHPAWTGMVDVVTTTGQPKHFMADFWIHDRVTVERNHAEQPFIWCVGDTGTTFIWEGGRHDAGSLAETLRHERPAFYYWDGETLSKIDFERLKALLSGKDL